ncbi:hypothetical protein D9M71_452060 [compost metagenome]
MCLLFLGTELDDHRADHHGAERQHARGAEGGAFFLEDVLLDHAPAGAAVFNRPQRGMPAALVQGTHPEDVVFLAQALAQLDLGRQVGRQFLAQEGTHFFTEGELFGRVMDIHRGVPQALLSDRLYRRLWHRPGRPGRRYIGLRVSGSGRRMALVRSEQFEGYCRVKPAGLAGLRLCSRARARRPPSFLQVAPALRRSELAREPQANAQALGRGHGPLLQIRAPLRCRGTR